MKLNLTKTLLLAGACAFAAPSIASAAWTKTYVLEWAEPAMYYGAKDGLIEPGTDCPEGNKEPNWVNILMEAGYTKEEAEWLRNPANPTRSAVHGQNQMAFRGKDRANVYIHPESTPESGFLKEMTGKVAEGIDIDGNPNTGFLSVDGKTKGIDNNFYKAVGCWKTYRGPPRKSTGPLSMNDGMREGSFTVVIVVNGKGNDPMNDNDVSVGFYNSADKMVKDANGGVARAYTFRIKPDATYEALFKARTVKGQIISTQAMDQVTIREPSYTRKLELLKAKISLTMNKDGTLKGYVAGYRPWEPVYKSWVDARGPVIESLTWVRLPDVYYALKRNADYSPTGPKGEKTHISFNLRVEAIPAYVLTPDAKIEVASVGSYKSVAPKPDLRPQPVTGFGVIDGIVVGRGGSAAAVSQTAEQLRPPKPLASAAGAANGG